MPKFSTENQPKGRGKSEKTKYFEALERAGKTPDDFYDLVMKRAFDLEDNYAFKEVLSRISPVTKSVAPMIEYEFPENPTPLNISMAITKGVANGEIPPDIGMQLNASLAQTMKIQEVTDFDERLKVMESQLEQD